MSPRNRFNRRHVLPVTLIFIGVILSTLGVFVAVDYITRTRTGQAVPVASRTVSTDDPAPSEKVPDVNNADYTVSANQPRLIRLPSLNVEAFVQRVGVTPDNEMATPSNINFGGWYVRSVSPGDKGVSIINGHVSGKYSPGVFKRLSSLKKADVIRIQMGDLSWREFNVESVTEYDVAKASAPLYADNPSVNSELHLITCGGPFDGASQEYSKRTIVVANYTD